jgi:hypothetical protein
VYSLKGEVMTTHQDAIAYSHNFATAKPNIPLMEKEHILGLCKVLESVGSERDALAAHVERQSELLRRLVAAMHAYEMDVDWDQPPPLDHRAMMADTYLAIEATPTISLARLKAQWQAEFLDEMAVLTEQDNEQWTSKALRDEAKRLRGHVQDESAA